MGYSRNMSVEQPGCLIFLLDQSSSMQDPFPHDTLVGQTRSKAFWLTRMMNEFLYELVLENTSGTRVRNRMDIAVIGYGGTFVGSVLPPALARHDFVTLQQLADHPLRVETTMQQFVDEDGTLHEYEEMRNVWFDPTHSGATPMVAVLSHACVLAERWVQRHPASYPPIVIHVTDGLSSDGDPIPEADRLRELRTDDGQLLLYNCHITDQKTDPIRWPHSVDQIVPKKSAHTLFEMSSPLPERARQQLAQNGSDKPEPAARGYIYNGNPAALQSMFEFGTVATRLVVDPQR